MSDPAVEAARRASREDPGWPKRVIAEEAAREALKPIRDLVERAEDHGDYVSIDAIKKLIYATEELEQ